MSAFSDSFDVGFEHDDRIGRPLQRRRSRILRRSLLLLGLGALGWVTYTDPSSWSRLWSMVEPAVSTLVGPAPTVTTDAPPAAAAPQRAALNAEPEFIPISPIPVVATAPEPREQPIPAVTKPAPTEPAEVKSAEEEARDAAITAMRAPLTDPLQKRAAAVGLHPDLSSALLKQLSDADFKTAATAINKALAETGDTETLVWPRKAVPGAFRFQVSFVQGAPAACRRYIVEIAKDGWQTTALPMEKCGVRRVAAKRG